MSGTENSEESQDRSTTSEATDDFRESVLKRVAGVLNRDTEIDGLRHLLDRVREGPLPDLPKGARIALGFDTNAIFRLGLGQAGTDALDYLRTQHKAPIVVPGQALQELWNNKLAALVPQATTLQKKFDDLREELEGIGEQLGTTGKRAQAALRDLLAEYGYLIDPGHQKVLTSTLEVLAEVGVESYVPRLTFVTLAAVRNDTKTPPGYRDDGHGDFFLWADFLYGLARLDPGTFDAAVLVTNDVKPDWSRNGVPHPILISEVMAVCGVAFRLWTIKEFHTYAKDVAE